MSKVRNKLQRPRKTHFLELFSSELVPEPSNPLLNLSKRAMLHQTTTLSSSVRLNISSQPMRTVAEPWTWKSWLKRPARPSRKPPNSTPRPIRTATALSRSLNSFRRRPQKKPHPCPNPSHPYEGPWDQRQPTQPSAPVQQPPPSTTSSATWQQQPPAARLASAATPASAGLAAATTAAATGHSMASCNRKHLWFNRPFDRRSLPQLRDWT